MPHAAWLLWFCRVTSRVRSLPSSPPSSLPVAAPLPTSFPQRLQQPAPHSYRSLPLAFPVVPASSIAHPRPLNVPLFRPTPPFPSPAPSAMPGHGPINCAKISRAFFHTPHPCHKIMLISIPFPVLRFSGAHFQLKKARPNRKPPIFCPFSLPWALSTPISTPLLAANAAARMHGSRLPPRRQPLLQGPLPPALIAFPPCLVLPPPSGSSFYLPVLLAARTRPWCPRALSAAGFFSFFSRKSHAPRSKTISPAVGKAGPLGCLALSPPPKGAIPPCAARRPASPPAGPSPLAGRGFSQKPASLRLLHVARTHAVAPSPCTEV